MRREVYTCDICGKPIDFECISSHYKVKRNWYDLMWYKIDVHDECVEELLKAVRKDKDND